MIKIAILLSLKSALVLHSHLCVDAQISRIEPEAEKTRYRDPGKDTVEPESHETDCSVKEPMNQVPFSVDAMLRILTEWYGVFGRCSDL
jgi:hypothetical protein